MRNSIPSSETSKSQKVKMYRCHEYELRCRYPVNAIHVYACEDENSWSNLHIMAFHNLFTKVIIVKMATTMNNKEPENLQ